MSDHRSQENLSGFVVLTGAGDLVRADKFERGQEIAAHLRSAAERLDDSFADIAALLFELATWQALQLEGVHALAQSLDAHAQAGLIYGREHEGSAGGAPNVMRAVSDRIADYASIHRYVAYAFIALTVLGAVVAILDEFAFHDDAGELLKAAMALLIWGGKVLVISTHNGADNPFNELINEVRSKRRPGIVVRTTFDDALRQGLYQRICLVTGKNWTPEGEATWRDDIRAFYGADAQEELDCIPSQGSGVYLTTAVIEACMTRDTPVLRYACEDAFALKSDKERHAATQDWLDEHVAPLLDALDKNLPHVYGFDFGRSGHLSVLLPLTIGTDLMHRAPFLLELRNVPFTQQEQILFYIVGRLPRFMAGKHDARGNGQFLAERAQQKFGVERIEAVMLSQAWYLAHAPLLKAAFEDRLIEIPYDLDIRSDFRQIRMVRGVPKVPDDAETQGTDGGKRHGDAAVAGMLAEAAAKADWAEYGYRAASAERAANAGGPDESENSGGRPWWRQPLGSGLRGSL